MVKHKDTLRGLVGDENPQEFPNCIRNGLSSHIKAEEADVIFASGEKRETHVNVF
jgi:hypothetical protein